MKSFLYCALGAFATVALSFVVNESAGAQSSNTVPMLAIAPDTSGTNSFIVSVTNALPGRVYRIEKCATPSAAGGWQFHLQTTSNFTVAPLANSSQFFRAILLTQALPDIVSFNINPATLSSNGPATVNWLVNGATRVTLDHAIGDVTGTTSRLANITGTSTYKLVATNGVGSVTGMATVVVGQLPSASIGRYSAIISPTPGQHFFAPGMVRVFAAAYDPDIPTNFPQDGKGGNASRVEYLLDNQVVQTMSGDDAEYWVFRATLTNLAAGPHVLRARAFYTNMAPTLILDSDPVMFTVDASPVYASVTNLTQDIVLSGAQSFQLIGTPAARVRLNANGFRIRTSGTWTGQFTMQYADVSDLSPFNSSTSGIDVTSTKGFKMENCIFDGCGTISLTFNGTNTASVSSNEFRSNMTMPLSQYPDDFGDPQSSFPAIRLMGSSTGQKVFAANNMGAGWLRLTGVNNWTIGGDTDAAENVFIGPRVGIMLESGANHITVRRNYSHHVYYGGWSQGNNFELGDCNDHVIVEHNIVRDSSWAVRAVACEFRYNLVLGAGHEWMWITSDNAYVHHNIFAGGSADVAGIWMIYEPQNVRFWNNTLDGFGETAGPSVLLVDTAATADVQSCAFLRNNSPSVIEVDGTLTTAGNNAFYNPGVAGLKNYSDNSHPATDVGALNAQVNPKFTSTTNSVGIDDSAMWLRTTSVREVLQTYRTRYTPAVGSPLIDTGHGGNGNDIGAVGAGLSNTNDLFGILNP
jgi:hypothetical protein